MHIQAIHIIKLIQTVQSLHSTFQHIQAIHIIKHMQALLIIIFYFYFV